MRGRGGVVHGPECIGRDGAVAARLRRASIHAMVDFSLTDENKLVADSARAFAEAEILPHIRDWDRGDGYPRAMLDKLAEQGFLGAPIPERYGGAGMDYLSFAILCEELERADTAFRVVQSVHVGLNSLALLQWGTEEQRQRWLVPQATGREARHVRADRARRRDRRRRTWPRPRAATATRYRLNGAKQWISLADMADHFLVFATVDRSKGHKGVTAFLLERGMAGLSTGTLHGKLGIRAGNTGHDQPRRRRRPGRAPHRRGGRGLPRRDERHRPGSLHRRGRGGRARPGLPRRLRRSTPTSAGPSARRSASTSWSSSSSPRWPPARRWAGCSCGAPAGSRTRAGATPARRAWPSGTPPSTRSRAPSTPSRSTAPTATATSSRSSATCATPRPP